MWAGVNIKVGERRAVLIIGCTLESQHFPRISWAWDRRNSLVANHRTWFPWLTENHSSLSRVDMLDPVLSFDESIWYCEAKTTLATNRPANGKHFYHFSVGPEVQILQLCTPNANPVIWLVNVGTLQTRLCRPFMIIYPKFRYHS